MQKVTLSFEVDAAKVPEILKVLNGVGSSGKAAKPKKDDDLELDLGDDSDDMEELNLDDDSDTEITEETLREKAAEIIKAKKKPLLAKVFEKYKVKNISGVKPAKFEAFYNDLCKIKI